MSIKAQKRSCRVGGAGKVGDRAAVATSTPLPAPLAVPEASPQAPLNSSASFLEPLSAGRGLLWRLRSQVEGFLPSLRV